MGCWIGIVKLSRLSNGLVVILIVRTSVRNGIRQGGILSPLLFNIYIDSVIHALRVSDLGCHLVDVYVGCIAYADYQLR